MRSSRRSGISITADAIILLVFCAVSPAGVWDNTLETGWNITGKAPVSILAAGSAGAWGASRLENPLGSEGFLTAKAFKALDTVNDFAYGPFLPASAGILWVGGELYGSDPVSEFGEELCRSLLFSYGITGVLKYSVARERPDGSNRLSFPSGHTAGAAALAAVTWNRLGPGAGTAAALLALHTALSRVNTGRHYPSDVIMGAAIGAACGVAAGVGGNDENGSSGKGLSIGIYIDTEGRIASLLW